LFIIFGNLTYLYLIQLLITSLLIYLNYEVITSNILKYKEGKPNQNSDKNF